MTNPEVQKQVLDGFRMELAPETPEDVVEVVCKRCWDANPESRWTVSQVARAMEAISGAKPPAQNKVKGVSASSSLPSLLFCFQKNMTQATNNTEVTVDRTTEDRTKEDKGEGKKASKPKARQKASTRKSAPSRKKGARS